MMSALMDELLVVPLAAMPFLIADMPRQRCWLVQRWPNVGTVVPTLVQRQPNLYCYLGAFPFVSDNYFRQYGF